MSGPVRSLQMALKDAGTSSLQMIDYINAHATSTQAGDSSEARALAEVFGEQKVPVSSTKSMTGHECWMAGASEIVYSMIMMQNGFIAPNINFENPDEDSAKLNIVKTTPEKNINVFLSNSFGFGGTNSSLIVRKWKLTSYITLTLTMKQHQPIIDKINGLLSEEFEVDINRMLPGANLRQVLELDSLDYIDLVVVIENNFSFKVKPEDFLQHYQFPGFLFVYHLPRSI